LSEQSEYALASYAAYSFLDAESVTTLQATRGKKAPDLTDEPNQLVRTVKNFICWGVDGSRVIRELEEERGLVARTRRYIAEIDQIVERIINLEDEGERKRYLGGDDSPAITY